MKEIFKILKDPTNPNFWTALSFFATLLIGFGGFIGWLTTFISKNSVTKTTKILIKSIVEIYTDWVKVRSEHQNVDNESIKIWISDLFSPEKEDYLQWVNKYDSGAKWGRIEW